MKDHNEDQGISYNLKFREGEGWEMETAWVLIAEQGSVRPFETEKEAMRELHLALVRGVL